MLAVRRLVFRRARVHKCFMGPYSHYLLLFSCATLYAIASPSRVSVVALVFVVTISACCLVMRHWIIDTLRPDFSRDFRFDPAYACFWLFRYVTSWFRVAPDFCIVGAEKSGTTSLADWVGRHPEAHMFFEKETHHFVGRMGPRLSLSTTLYRAYFPTVPYAWWRRFIGKPLLFGESSPDFFFFPYVAERLFKVNPRMKIIISLRDPVERAYSGWTMWRGGTGADFEGGIRYEDGLRQSFAETARDFEATTPGTRLPCWLQLYGESAYVQRSQYLPQMLNMLRYFPAAQILVIDAGDLFAAPHATMAEVCRFLGVSEAPVENLPLTAKNVGPRGPEMPAKVRAHLESVLYSDDMELSKLLKKKFGWMRQ